MREEKNGHTSGYNLNITPARAENKLETKNMPFFMCVYRGGQRWMYNRDISGCPSLRTMHRNSQPYRS